MPARSEHPAQPWRRPARNVAGPWQGLGSCPGRVTQRRQGQLAAGSRISHVPTPAWPGRQPAEGGNVRKGTTGDVDSPPGQRGLSLALQHPRFSLAIPVSSPDSPVGRWAKKESGDQIPFAPAPDTSQGAPALAGFRDFYIFLLSFLAHWDCLGCSEGTCEIKSLKAYRQTGVEGAFGIPGTGWKGSPPVIEMPGDCELSGWPWLRALRNVRQEHLMKHPAPWPAVGRCSKRCVFVCPIFRTVSQHASLC